MRVATVDGLVTLFYDGSKELYNQELQREVQERRRNINHVEEDDDWESWDLSDECKEYFRERLSWQQVIVVDGVTEIPERTFYTCLNIKKVIFADTVVRIRGWAFYCCKSLVFVKWSLRLEYISQAAFQYCNLSSVFIPPRCREIGGWAFASNPNLTIFNIPQDTNVRDTYLEDWIIDSTTLLQRCPNRSSMNTWLKHINNHENFALHRVCSSFEPSLDMILNTMMEKGGPQTFQVENGIGITPSKYLKENPYAHVKEKDIIEKYIRHMMGENF